MAQRLIPLVSISLSKYSAPSTLSRIVLVKGGRGYDFWRPLRAKFNIAQGLVPLVSISLPKYSPPSILLRIALARFGRGWYGSSLPFLLGQILPGF